MKVGENKVKNTALTISFKFGQNLKNPFIYNKIVIGVKKIKVLCCIFYQKSFLVVGEGHWRLQIKEK